MFAARRRSGGQTLQQIATASKTRANVRLRIPISARSAHVITCPDYNLEVLVAVRENSTGGRPCAQSPPFAITAPCGEQQTSAFRHAKTFASASTMERKGL